MRLPQIAVKNPVFTAMVFVAILIFGLVSLFSLPKDVLPDIELPTLTVMTIYPGASAREVEEQVSKKLETYLAAASNLKSIKSNSRENVSFVIMQFNWGENLDQASNNIRDLIEFAKTDLPSEAGTPIIYKFTSSVMPVLVYNIEADESFNGLNKICEDQVTNRIQRLSGVGTTIVIGQPEREIVVQCNPFQLAAFNLTPSEIAQAMKMQNISIPAGMIDDGKMGISVRMPAEFGSIEEISQMPISSFNGEIIRVCDVATVKDTMKNSDCYIHSFGKKSVIMLVQKQSDANTLTVAKAVKKEVKAIQNSLPQDVKITELMDMSELVSESINNLSSSIFYAAFFVILVVLFFLKDFHSSLIIIMTIPFSLVSAFIFMLLSGYTINIISLIALAVTIGMVVDNAIVILENITRHIENGTRSKEAAIFGTGEMGMAITGSTLTTIVVFLPMIFMSGLVGIMFKQLAVIVTVTLLASLFTALTLTPMLSSKLLKVPVKGRVRKHHKLYNICEAILHYIGEVYAKTLNFSLNNRKIVLWAFITIFCITIALSFTIGTGYIPNVDAGDLNAVIELDVGVNAKETERVAAMVEQIFLEEVPELRSMYSVSGQTDQGLLTSVGFKEGINVSTIGAKLVLPEDRKRSAAEIAQVLRQRIEQIPEVEKMNVVSGSILMDAVLGNVKPIEVKITGNNLDDIELTAGSIEQKLRKLPFLVNLESSVDAGKPEIRVIVDKDKASTLGINPAIIGMTLRQSIFGVADSEYKDRGDAYDITVRYAPEFRNNIDQLKNVSINTLTGQTISLGSIATIEEGRGISEIKHEAQQRVVYLSADIDQISLNKAVKIVNNTIQDIETPSGISVDIGGQITDQRETFRDLTMLFILGMILVYMVMASLFGTYRDPFIIIFAVPMALTGVIWAFVICHVTLNIVSFFGIVMLLGIVVNNGIVLVNYTNLLRARGQNLKESLINAGKSRVRPVLMTAFTTIFGMVPMALSTGLGSEIWRPFGISVIGGLLISTLITLILIPVFYYFAHHREENRGAL